MKRDKLICFIQFFLIGLLLVSCNDNRAGRLNAHRNSIENSLQTIQVFDTETEQPLLLSKFVREMNFVPLEFNENCMLRNIEKIRVIGSDIFLFDDIEAGVFRFDTTGGFICQIGNKGRGPGEHLRLTDFSVNPDSRSVYIYCNSNQRAFEYTYEGEFVKAIDMNHAADAFEYYDRLFYMYRENPVLYEDYNLVIKTTKGETIARYFRSNHEFKTNGKWVFSPTPNDLLLMNPNHDTIYKILGKQVNHAYYIDYGESKITNPDHYKELMARSPQDRLGPLKMLLKYRYVVGSYNFMEIGNWVYFTYVKDIYTKYALYNTVTGVTLTGISLTNDINGVSIGSPISLTDDFLISVYQPEKIARDIDRIGKLKIDNSNEIMRENFDRIVPLLPIDAEQANPLLVFLKVL